MSRVISINNIIAKASLRTRLLVWFLDRLLGIRKMNKLYHQHEMPGLSKGDFADKLISLLELDIEGLEALKSKIPASGPVVIASNHPFGGIEGVILARHISEVRPDLKVLANKGLGIFKELADYFIFTNPLSPKDPKNGPSLRQCISHVKAAKALLIFPAGKVSYFQNDKGRISEHSWNKVVGRLISIDKCQYLPVFVAGQNSKAFYQVERFYFKLRMLLLGREILNKTGAKISIGTANPLESKHIKTMDFEAKAALARALSYAQDPYWRYQWPADTVTHYKDLAQALPSSVLASEIAALPKEQLIANSKGFDVYYAFQNQAPKVVIEIARLRELVFRSYNEGSGEPIDTDGFDATYTHLFIVEREHSKIIGAYRMGQSDKLIDESGLDGLYLNKMFNFGENFVNRKEPCLEMGRSFLIPEYQGSYQGLLLLWRGICAFAKTFPQYRTLYGTVSISKLYDPRSVALIKHCLIGDTKSDLSPVNEFTFELHPELADYFKAPESKSELSSFLRSIESDGKDIPVLAKQYLKMGAKFHALGIDKSFNHTPGLLLSVDLAKAPTRLLKLYMGEGFEKYRDYNN